MARERGSGKTPQRVVELLQKEVDEKSMLAVSRSTGLGLAAIGRYLKGIGEPTTATLEKLATYFAVSVAFLRGENYDAVSVRRQEGSEAWEELLLSIKMPETQEGQAREELEKYKEVLLSYFSLPGHDKERVFKLLKIIRNHKEKFGGDTNK